MPHRVQQPFLHIAELQIAFGTCDHIGHGRRVIYWGHSSRNRKCHQQKVKFSELCKCEGVLNVSHSIGRCWKFLIIQNVWSFCLLMEWVWNYSRLRSSFVFGMEVLIHEVKLDHKLAIGGSFFMMQFPMNLRWYHRTHLWLIWTKVHGRMIQSGTNK